MEGMLSLDSGRTCCTGSSRTVSAAAAAARMGVAWVQQGRRCDAESRSDPDQALFLVIRSVSAKKALHPLREHRLAPRHRFAGMGVAGHELGVPVT
jgi:hypothetical protein